MGRLLANLLLTLFCISAAAKRLATLVTGNSTAAVDNDLFARGVFARLPGESLTERQACNAPGWGQCSTGQCCPLNAGCCGSGCINVANTCCDNGGICPPKNGCCYGSCAPPGWTCCGYNGGIVPLDGSACCSDGRYCNPGEYCGSCDDGSGLICCYGNGEAQSEATFSTDIATYTGGPSYSTSYSASYSATSSADAATATAITTAPTSSALSSSSYYTSTGDQYTWSYYSTVYVYYYTTFYLSAYFETMSSDFSSLTSGSTTITVFASDYYAASYSFEVAATSVQSLVDTSASAEAVSVARSYTSIQATASVMGGSGGSLSAGVRSAGVGRLGCILVAVGAAAGSLAVLL